MCLCQGLRAAMWQHRGPRTLASAKWLGVIWRLPEGTTITSPRQKRTRMPLQSPHHQEGPGLPDSFSPQGILHLLLRTSVAGFLLTWNSLPTFKSKRKHKLYLPGEKNVPCFWTIAYNHMLNFRNDSELSICFFKSAVIQSCQQWGRKMRENVKAELLKDDD